MRLIVAPRRRFPVDVARILARNISAQALEVRARSFEGARLAHDFVPLVDLRQQLILIGAVEVGIDFRRVGDGERQLLLDQAALAWHAQDHVAEAVGAAFQRPHGIGQLRLAAGRDDRRRQFRS